MARKKKNKQAIRQKKNQRRASVSQKRKKQRSTLKPFHAQPNVQDEGLIGDMSPLFPDAFDNSMPADASIKAMMTALVESHKLADTPEFKEFMPDPWETAQTFLMTVEAGGIRPEAFDTMTAEAQEEHRLDMLDLTIEKVFADEEIRTETLDRLEQLRLRFKQSRRHQKQVPQVAAIQTALSDNTSETRQVWPTIGLLQALVRRSVTTGFDLLETLETEDLTVDETKMSAIEKTETLLKKVPSLGKLLEKKVDTVWEDGLEAMLNGELHLGIYDEAELEVASQHFNKAIGQDSDDPETEAEITKEVGQTLVSTLDAYLTEIFTPTRLELLRNHIDKLLNDSAIPKQWSAFGLMIKTYLTDDNALEMSKPFLLKALFSELRYASEPTDETKDIPE